MSTILSLFLLILKVASTYKESHTFTDASGSTFVIQISNKISKTLKEKIANLDGAEAYNDFISVYGAFLKNPRLLVSGDPDTMKNLEKKTQKNFKKSLDAIREHNKKFKDGKTKYSMLPNVFTVMDEWERSQYLGEIKNNSLKAVSPPPDIHKPKCKDKLSREQCLALKSKGRCESLAKAEQCEETCEACGKFKFPETLDWNARGYVTGVKNQGYCGSCWSFAAVGAIEALFKKTTSKLVQFSEQELLDCSYPDDSSSGSNPGCGGGLHTAGWEYIIKNKRLAVMADYEYNAVDSFCTPKRFLDLSIPSPFGSQLELLEYYRIPPHLPNNEREDILVGAMQLMPVAIGIFVETQLNDNVFEMGEGIFDNCATARQPNHAVLLTGYGPDYWEIKNSWGPDWGTNGFGRFERKRGQNTCFIFDFAYFLSYKDLDPNNGEPDFPREYVEDDEEEKSCQDSEKYASNCPEWATRHCKEGDKFYQFMIDHCSKSCRFCVSCSAGQYLSSDGTCKTCPVNTFNSEENARKCVPCPIGTVSKAGSKTPGECVECKPGTHSPPGTGTCQTCPLNTYSPSAAVVCTECPEGYFSRPGSTKLSDCVKPPLTCADALPKAECEAHNKAGHCNSKEYISKLKLACKKTCAYCVDKEKTEGCEDSEEHCEYWSNLGYCQATSQYHAYMNENCRKSCNKCKTSKCAMAADLDSSYNCRIWKSQGYCSSAYDYMKQRCGTTCGICKNTKPSYTSKNCVDTIAQCPYYVGAGYCYSSKAYMTQYCSKSCGFCKTSFCQDQNTQCGVWADSGECSRNPAYMHLNCKASCNKCGVSGGSSSGSSGSGSSGTGTCTDYNTMCPYWASNRQCASNPTYMLTYCKKSCNKCGVSASTTSCADQHTSCSYWAGQQQCRYNPGYMHQHCRMSCNLCKLSASSGSGSGGGSTSCTDSDSRCPAWASNHQCYYNPAYMNTYCKKSCKKCGGRVSSGGSVTHCADKDANCGYYASTYRYCQYGSAYYNYMRQNCQKSCRWC